MITTDHSALIKCEDDCIIWRYIDLEKFELLLRENALFLCRSDKFSDPFEGSIPKRESEHRAKTHRQRMTEEKAILMDRVFADNHQKSKKAFIVNCWNISTNESDAMWRLYLKTNEGVAIQSSYKRLYESLTLNEEELLMSMVRYINYETDVWYHPTEYPNTNYNFYVPLVHKRVEFIHENELRVFHEVKDATNDIRYWDKQINQFGKNIPCKISVFNR